MSDVLLRKKRGKLFDVNGKDVYGVVPPSYVKWEAYMILPCNEERFLDLLRYLAPGDLRVFLAVARRLDYSVGYVRKGDYKTIAADLDMSLSTAIRCLERIQKPLNVVMQEKALKRQDGSSVSLRGHVRKDKPVNLKAAQQRQDRVEKAEIPDLIRILTVPEGPEAGAVVWVLNPNYVMAGLHDKCRKNWEAAGAQIAFNANLPSLIESAWHYVINGMSEEEAAEEVCLDSVEYKAVLQELRARSQRVLMEKSHENPEIDEEIAIAPFGAD